MKVHRSNQELQDAIEGYKELVKMQRQEIYDLKIVLKKLSFRFQVASSSEPGDDKI